jgi:hypothetical protein
LTSGSASESAIFWTRIHYYRCAHKNKKQVCDDRSFIRQEKFAEEVKRNTALASIPEEWKERFLARIETWEAEEYQTSQAQVDRLKAELATLKAKIDRINNAFTEGAMELQEFKEIKNPLVARKTELEQQAAVFTARRTNLRIPMNSDTHSENNRTLIRDCRTVVGA